MTPNGNGGPVLGMIPHLCDVQGASDDVGPCATCDEYACDCDYPHGHDFDPWIYERCTYEPTCYHVAPLELPE